MNPEETYLQHLRTIERIASFVARRNHLNADEAAEFIQEVRVRLLDDDYAIIRKFEGRSTFSTYLTTVINRLFHQWRVEQWGKWRPSAEARRLGDKAIVLERYLSRDGYTFSEAVETLTTPAGSHFTVAELEAIYVRLPLRNPRPVVVSDELLPESIAGDGDADERVQNSERERTARRAAAAMDNLLRQMDAEDRLILEMRFWGSRKVPDIATILHLDQKKTYKRLDRLYLALRRGLESAGLSKSDVVGLFGRGDQEIHLDIVTAEIRAIRPSKERGGSNGRGGKGRSK
jgi:RNA polymerase sigma factor for flagellar operon FliA